MNEPQVIRAMLGEDMLLGTAERPRTLAVIGLSDRPDRPSYYVSAYMQQQGYHILPINPSVPAVLGETSFASLSALKERPDVVNVFRMPSFIPAIVDEVLALGLTDLWVQQGIMHREAAHRAEAAGIRVVMDRCIMIEHRRAKASRS
ncbi:MAG: CoA-binding protein [Rhodospirillales bacterium]|nr:CoA-binding protein [Acetobacter sp.]